LFNSTVPPASCFGKVVFNDGHEGSYVNLNPDYAHREHNSIEQENNSTILLTPPTFFKVFSVLIYFENYAHLATLHAPKAITSSFQIAFPADFPKADVCDLHLVCLSVYPSPLNC
jgi:hypothetical protein